MSLVRLPGRFLVLFWAVNAPFVEALELAGPHLGASWPQFGTLGVNNGAQMSAGSVF